MARILLIEDSADFRDALSRFLGKAGHEVTSVSNGREGLAKVLAEPPDLILTDVQMPELDGPSFLEDGPSFLEVVRSYLRMYSVPVVVLTGIEDGPLLDRTRAQKVNSILVKGKASLDDILKAVDEALVTLPT